MLATTQKKRIWIFIAIAFGISWATAGVIYLTGGLQNSPSLAISGTSLTLAGLLLPTAYMFGPAIANLLTRLVTKEGKADLLLEPKFNQKRWVHWLLAWFLPGVLTLLGLLLFFLILPQYYDPTLGTLSQQLEASGATRVPSLWLVVILQVLQALVLAPLLNAVATFGEEFGWRGYLQMKLMPLGPRKAILLTGLIWGVWHWPLIMMGHNYGLDYFGAPFLGLLAMLWFAVVVGVLLGWLTVRSGSVWPAVIAHAGLNGIAALGMLFIKGTPSTLLGPAPPGLIGGLGFTLAAVLILVLPDSLKDAGSESQ
ncbi:CPBP family intramembrane metalloprotease [bacterium]|nr:CPBP family intramembrane metalloprotease [bacterium]